MKKFLLALAAVMLSLSTYANDTKWVGYYDGESDRASLGTGTQETYDVASKFDGTFYTGKKINAVRIYLRSKEGIGDLKLWVSKKLPSSGTAADILCMDLDITKLNTGDVSEYNVGLPNDIQLPEAIEVGAEGVYVGYSFTITESSSLFKPMSTQNQYPVATAPSYTRDEALLFHSSKKITAWEAFGLSYGDLAIMLNLEGTFYSCAAAPSAIDARYAEINGTATFDVPFVNNGFTSINSLTYKAEANGTTYTGTVNLDAPVARLMEEGTFEITIPADSKESTQDVVVTITGVNGQTNELPNASSTTQLVTMKKVPTHRVAVEEWTGTGCGFCPRGWQGMENLRAAYGDLFVGVAIHQYNNDDAMYIATNKYKSLGFNGAPSCKVNRGAIVDPYYGSMSVNNGILLDFKKASMTLAPVDVTVTGEWDASKSTINAVANIEAIVDGNYDIEYIAIADDLHNADNVTVNKRTTYVWNQSNYYTSYDASTFPEDMKKFAVGGEYGVSEIKDLHFNDVAICSSIVSSKNQAKAIGTLSAGDKTENSYEMPFTVTDPVKDVLDYEKVYIIALVLDNATGEVVNAAKAQVVKEGTSAINDVNASSECIPVSFHSVDGKAASAPQRGMNIIRFSDGSVRKVIIK